MPVEHLDIPYCCIQLWFMKFLRDKKVESGWWKFFLKKFEILRKDSIANCLLFLVTDLSYYLLSLE